MAGHTIDEVYDKAVSIDEKVDKLPSGGGSQAVTTKELNDQVAKLKTAIEEGPKEKAKDWKDALGEIPIFKELLALFKAIDGWVAGLILTVVAVKALFSVIGLQFLDVKKAFAAFTRNRTGGREFTTNDGGRMTLAAPEQPLQTNLPSLDAVNQVKRAIQQLNEEVHTYNSNARELPSARTMKATSKAAEKLSPAIARLGGSLRDFPHNKLPDAERLNATASAARNLTTDMAGLRQRLQEASQALSPGAA